MALCASARRAAEQDHFQARGVFVTNPNKTSNDPDDALFQAYDETSGQAVDGVFLAGWARKASEGLVGVAKRDGEWCAEVVSRYLNTKAPLSRASVEGILSKLQTTLKNRNSRPVSAKGLRVLDTAEQAHKGQTDCIGAFKYVSNREMLGLIEKALS